MRQNRNPHQPRGLSYQGKGNDIVASLLPRADTTTSSSPNNDSHELRELDSTHTGTTSGSGTTTGTRTARPNANMPSLPTFTRRGKRPLSDETGGFNLVSREDWIGSVARFWQRSYMPDYLGLTVLVVLYIVLEFFAEPFHRLFNLSNINIAYPHAEKERVPVSMMFLYGGGLPLAAIILWLFATRSHSHKHHVTILSFFIAMLLTSFITDLIKNAVGRPRPDLLSRCIPREGTPIHTLVSIDVCTQTDHHVLHDGWRSFPSGHSSFAFSGLGFLSLFLAGQMHVFRPEGDLMRGLIALLPLLGAALIAISRCEDYRHDVYDVTCGSILGFAVAYWSYRRFYPRLRSRNCGKPYQSRMSAQSSFAKVGDEEDQQVLRNGTGPSAFNLTGGSSSSESD